MERKKVYIIDYDLLSPLGISKSAIFENLENNLCCESKTENFNASGLPYTNCAEIKLNLENFYLSEPDYILEAIHFDRKLELAVASYHLMRNRLQSIFSLVPANRAGVILGLGVDVPSFEKVKNDTNSQRRSKNEHFNSIVRRHNKGNAKINALFNSIDIYSIYLAERLGLGAFQKTIMTACTSSTQALAFAYESIVNDEADIVLAGGTDSIINPIAFMAFSKLGVLAEPTADYRSCKPFDINRAGTLAGEAAGLCVLASEETVKKNKLIPLFQFMGYGNTMDAYKITAPDPAGKGIKNAIRSMLKNAQLSAKDIDYINLHGTGTRNNDCVELDSFLDVMGDDLAAIPMSSTKDRHGHAIAAAGIQELVILCESLRNNFIPCNLNMRKPIKEKGFDLVQDKNRYHAIRTGVSVNFAFGGINTALVIKKV